VPTQVLYLNGIAISVTIMPFNNAKLNYVRLYSKEVNLRKIGLTKRKSYHSALTQFRVILLNDMRVA